jgi:hypothetical protein
MTAMRWIVFALAAMACGHASPTPAPVAPPPARVVIAPPPAPPLPLDRDLPRLVDRLLAMYQAIGDALIGSCDEVTVRLVALPFGDVPAAITKVLHDGRGSDLHAALAGHDSRFAELGRRITESPVIASCAGNAVFADALDKVIGGAP